MTSNYTAITCQDVADTLHRSIEDAKSSWLFADWLVEAIANEIWAHPRQLSHSVAPPMPLLEWIKAPYPRGLGTTVGVVKRILAACGDDAAMAAWDNVVREQPGGEAALQNGALDRLKADWYRIGRAQRAAITAWIERQRS
jgi:hypothetical protein